MSKALVTGASSGIGAAYAEALAARGVDLVLVARREDRLQELAARLRENHGVQAEAMAADLTNPADLAGVEDALRTGGVDMLINNAGFGAYMPFVDLPVERAEELLRLKVIAPTLLTRAALPSMLSRGSGTVVNVASLLAFSASLQMPQLPQRASYAAANSFLVALTQLLHGEVGGRGIRVQALCPAMVRTDFHQIQNRDVSGLPNVMEPAEIVKASLAALEIGEVICEPTLGEASLIGEWERAAAQLMMGNQGSIAARYLTQGA